MFEIIMKKLGYISATQAKQQVIAAKMEATQKALAITPFEVIHLFAKDCRKFNFKVVSIEPNEDKVTQNAENLACHISERFNLKADDAEVKHLAAMVLPLMKVVDNKTLLS